MYDSNDNYFTIGRPFVNDFTAQRIARQLDKVQQEHGVAWATQFPMAVYPAK